MGKLLSYSAGDLSKKRDHICLTGFKTLVSKNPQIEFRIIGDGILRNSIGSFVKENNLSPYVHLLGYQSHYVFVEELGKAHIYIQPKRNCTEWR